MAKQVLRIRLVSYDHRLLDDSAQRIAEAAKRSGAKVSGLGMGGIPHSMEEMSNEKMMVIKSSVL